MPNPGSLIHTPYSDFSDLFEKKTRRDQCRPLALQFARCQDAYGYPHYIQKCRDEYDDLFECSTSTVGNARADALREQRRRLFKEGKIDQKYILPPPDSISQEHGFAD